MEDLRLQELWKQMTEFFCEEVLNNPEIKVNGFGIGLKDRDDPESRKMAIRIFLEEEITEEEKDEILKKINKRLFSFEVVGKTLLL